MPQPEPNREVPCPLVNPLCPDDLCVLWAGHPGSDQHEHLLGSMYGSAADVMHPKYRERMPNLMYLSVDGTTREQLIELGIKRARVLFGD